MKSTVYAHLENDYRFYRLPLFKATAVKYGWNTESSFEYTVLMDEPDRNLDIDNIMQIYNVLSFHKPQTQIIAIVHNPALIYKLSKLDCVNFIEMTEGYLNKTCTFVSN